MARSTTNDKDGKKGGGKTSASVPKTKKSTPAQAKAAGTVGERGSAPASSTASRTRRAGPASPPAAPVPTPMAPVREAGRADGLPGSRPELPSLRAGGLKGLFLSLRGFLSFWFARPGRAWASLGILAFLISLFSLFLAPRMTMRLYLEYPRLDGSGLRGETRYVPWRWGSEARARLVLQEILLGPESLNSRKYLSSSAVISTILLRKSVLYADIESGFLTEDPPPSGSWEGDFALIERLLKVNLPWLGSVVLTVDGVEAYGDAPEEGAEGPGEGEAPKADEA